MKGSVALVATGLALAAAGCLGGDDDEAAENRRPPKLVSTTVVEGGSARQRALLQRVVRGMQKTTLRRIAFGRVAARRRGAPRPAVAIAFKATPGPSVRRQWEEWVVAGALSRRLDAEGLPARVEGTGRDGIFTARPKLSGQPDPRPLPPRQEAAVVKGIRGAARRSGGELVRLEVHRPYGAAVALSLAAEDPASFLKKKLRPLIQKLGTQRMRLEGIYLAVLDERRALALEWGAWTRNPAGAYWVRRDLANCSPIEQSAPPGADPPPPCPA